jgi:hypothetical protein
MGFWNRPAWQKLHYRAIRVYAGITGAEAAASAREGRPFNKINACRALALAICGPEREANVDEMIRALAAEQGGYFAYLIDSFGAKVLPHLDNETLRLLIR